MTTYTATYSPDDNKLRLTASARLDAETYARVKEAGFSWAPKQEQFIAPMWTPSRADLCLELAGEIDDEDGTLMDRAEVRAERFAGYEAKRGSEAARAADHARALAGDIPFGQPILVGHHSEARARRDAKRIEAGLKRAVDLFDTSEYWKHRAAAAIGHARYVERADVRHRRIKGLESDQRKHQKALAEYATAARLWGKVPRFEWDKQTEIATLIAGRLPSTSANLYSALSDGRMHGDRAWRVALAGLDRCTAWAQRWLDHISHRLDYERAMLGEAGGIAADRFTIKVGGRVLIGGEWLVVLRVNRSAGRIVSVTTTARYVSVRGIEEVQDYRAPTAADAGAVARVSKLAPLCNYRSEGCVEMTSAEWKAHAGYDSYFVDKVKATETVGAHRRRTKCNSAGNWARVGVFLTDAKVSAPPAAAVQAEPAPVIERQRAVDPVTRIVETVLRPLQAAGIDGVPSIASLESEAQRIDAAAEGMPAQVAANYAGAASSLREIAEVERQRTAAPAPARSEIEAMRESLRAGVQTVSAPQLFPTPPDLAARMVAEADIDTGMRVLEPSAGTGRLLDALAGTGAAQVVAVEVSPALCRQLPSGTRCADFLRCTPAELGQFERVVMNPPFATGADVAHVTHAVQFLRPGGRLVAIMSAGVTFRSDKNTTDFRALVDRLGGTIEPLPPGTFDSSGTGANTVLVVLDAPGFDHERAAAHRAATGVAA